MSTQTSPSETVDADGSAQPVADRDTQGAPGDAPTEPMAPARPPRGVGLAPLVASVVALVLVALGVLALRDLLVAVHVLGGHEVISRGVLRVGTLAPEGWMVPVFIACVVVGLLLAYSGLKPRPRTGVRLAGRTGIYVRNRDLRTLVQQAASDTDGVEQAHVTVSSSRKVSVRVDSTVGKEGTAGVQSAVEAGVAPVIEAMEKPPRLSVRVVPAHEEGSA